LRLSLHVLLPLSCGGSIYVLFRPRTLVMFDWFDAMGLGALFDSLRNAASSVALPDVVLFSLPNALWLYAFVYLIRRLWPSGMGALWVVAPVLLGVGAEFGQLVGLVPGTFDLLDFSTSVVAVALALVSAQPDPHRSTVSAKPHPS
jgi:hypothetical protein